MSKKFEGGFGPLVATCGQYGISRTVAFRLVKKGLLRTFKIGRRRYVSLTSLLSLPERLADIPDEGDDREGAQDPTT